MTSSENMFQLLLLFVLFLMLSRLYTLHLVIFLTGYHYTQYSLKNSKISC